MLISKTYGSKLTSMHTSTNMNGTTTAIINSSNFDRFSLIMSFSNISNNSFIIVCILVFNISVKRFRLSSQTTGMSSN